MATSTIKGVATRDIITDCIETTTTASRNHIKGTYFMMNGLLYRADEGIVIGTALIPDENCTKVTITDELYSRKPRKVSLSYADIATIVQNGNARDHFEIGDQINVRWTNSGNVYDLPWDIVDFSDAVDANGTTKPAMWLESHYALPGVQFDASEALYYCDAALAPGTYYFTIGTNWGTHCISGKNYYFTTTTTIPSGGQIVLANGTNYFTWGAPDVDPSNWKVYTFSSNTSTIPLEGGLLLTEGISGTSLGTATSSIEYGSSEINNLQRAAYGYNRWAHSGLRQYLNSNAAAGAWWSAQNNHDRPPQQLSSMSGFIAGLPTDFADIIHPVRISTALNAVSDSEIGTSELTNDRFFLASLEQEFIVPQLSGAEGLAWDYWEQVLTDGPQKYYQSSSMTNADIGHIRYAIENHNSPQYCRLRSANRGSAYYTWNVHSTGSVYGSTSTSAHRFCPACVII